jgi:hypothetical protein
VAAFKNSTANFQTYSQHSPIKVISKNKEGYLRATGTTQLKSHWGLSETDNRIFTEKLDWAVIGNVTGFCFCT